MAWEWRIPASHVRAWSYSDFRNALSDLTDSRYASVRAKGRAEDEGERALAKYLR